jgi:hypothetical protein
LIAGFDWMAEHYYKTINHSAQLAKYLYSGLNKTGRGENPTIPANSSLAGSFLDVI